MVEVFSQFTVCYHDNGAVWRGCAIKSGASGTSGSAGRQASTPPIQPLRVEPGPVIPISLALHSPSSPQSWLAWFPNRTGRKEMGVVRQT
jgi:hypothetical protein